MIFVAESELERTRAEADFERIETYPEYPGLEHPMRILAREPGLYDSEVGGFRHSDTVAVTEDGYDLLTDYPDDLESLVIPANG